MEEKVLYFGYGANSQLEMMQAITGNNNLVGHPAVLKGYALGVQRLDQVPESPREVLLTSWAPEEFESYTIFSKEGAEVVGAIWELTSLERQLVRDWELVDFGWYKDERGVAVTPDGREIAIETEILGDGQEIDREVDGRVYEPYPDLIVAERILRVAEESRKECLRRIGISLEGRNTTLETPAKRSKETR